MVAAANIIANSPKVMDLRSRNIEMDDVRQMLPNLQVEE